MGAPREAWSQAEDDGVDEEPAHFSWERVGLIVAAGAVVVLLAFLVITALMPDNATPRPSQTSAPVAAPPPSVVPAPPPPSVVPAPTPTVTVTATPTRPTTTQASSPAELDQRYLTELSRLWGGGGPANTDAAISNGHRACELLAQNPDKSAATDTLLTQLSAAGKALTGALDPETEWTRTNAVVVAASDVYCPQ